MDGDIMMTKPITKKYWLFYQVKDGTLYAYTETKKFAKMFTTQRNMDEYRCIKREMSNGDIKWLGDNYETRALQIRSVKTRGSNNDVRTVDVAMTYAELVILDTEILYMRFNPERVIPDSLQGFLTSRTSLRKEYESALRKLMAYHFIAVKDGFITAKNEETLFAIDVTKIQIDELEIFIQCLKRYDV